MTEARRQEIEERLKRITPGPWAFSVGKDDAAVRFPGWSMVGAVAPGHRILANPPGGTYPSRDGEFIAHAPQDIADLLAEVKALREALGDFGGKDRQ